MKYIFSILALSTSAFAGNYASVPLSGNDIASILGLAASKNTITFDSPKNLILRYTFGKIHQDFTIGKSREIDLVTYSPSKEGGKDTIGIIVSKKADDGKSTSSIFTYFPAPDWLPGKGRFTRSDFSKDVFSISGANDENFSSLTYKLEIFSE